jgi:DNA polymerase phi
MGVLLLGSMGSCSLGPYDNSLRARSDVQIIDARRSWVIEQFTALIRNGAIPKSDEWVQLVLDWFIVHSIFFVKKPSRGSLISAVRITPSHLLETDPPLLNTQLHTAPSPPYPDHLRQQCRERLLSCLACLAQLSATTKMTERMQKISSVTSDGTFWVSKVLQTIRKLERDHKHVALLTEFDQEDREKLERACSVVTWLREVRPKLVLFVSSRVVIVSRSRVTEEKRHRVSNCSCSPVFFNVIS